MRIDLSGQRALVTGGARGIGAAAAAALRACGAEVAIADLKGDPPVDVADTVALERAFEQAGELDIVIANAGTAIFRRLEETSDAEWRRLVDINLTGAFHTVRLAALRMKPRRRGAIVLTASTNSFDGEADLTAYNATKAGLLGLMRTAANELGPFGIRVNAVCPGLIRTDLTVGHFAQPELLKEYFRHIPLGRGGTPEEVAAAIVFLASPLASYITGAALLVDGGQMAAKFGIWDERMGRFAGDHWEPGGSPSTTA
ncbi:MAG: SDR family oxidoreductase [Bryobacteraceae bacterium]|nr:SDR family oxidoreductase [Bryobacteraceae bacterium]